MRCIIALEGVAVIRETGNAYLVVKLSLMPIHLVTWGQQQWEQSRSGDSVLVQQHAKGLVQHYLQVGQLLLLWLSVWKSHSHAVLVLGIVRPSPPSFAHVRLLHCWTTHRSPLVKVSLHSFISNQTAMPVLTSHHDDCCHHDHLICLL